TAAVFCFFFSFNLRRPLCSTLFPYTTLFRSQQDGEAWTARSEAGDSSRLRRIAAAGAAMRQGRGARTLLDRRNDHGGRSAAHRRSEEHTSELQSRFDLVCRLLLEKKK